MTTKIDAMRMLKAGDDLQSQKIRQAIQQQRRAMPSSLIAPNPDNIVTADRIVSPSTASVTNDPTEPDFTGVVMTGDPITIDGVDWNLFGLLNGVVQWGARTSDAALMAGAGAVTLDADGIEILEGTGSPNSIEWKTADGTVIASIYADEFGVIPPPPDYNNLLVIKSITDATHDGQVSVLAKDIVLGDTLNSRSVLAYGGLTVNENMDAANDTIVKGDTDPNLIHADASADSVGFGIATPDANVKVDIYGGMNVGNSIEANVLTVRSDASRVGIGGVTDPDYTLDVGGTINATAYLLGGAALPFVKTAPATAAENTIQPSADVVALTAKLPTGGTKNIIEVRDAADGIIDAIKRDGKLVVGGDTAAATITGYGAPTAGNYAGFAFKSTGNNALFRSVVSQSTAGTFEAALSANLYFSGGSWLKDVSGKSGILMDFLPIYSTTPLFLLSSMPESTTSLIYPFVMFANTGAFRIGSTAFSTTAPLGRLEVTTNATTTIPLAIKAIASQIANSTIWTDSSDVVQASITPTGGAVFNEDGAATGDLRAESDTEANMLFLDADGDTDGALYLGGTTNGIKILKGGDITLLGTAKYERHVQIDAKADGIVGNQPTQVDFFTVGGLQFPTTGSKYSYCQWEIPDDWDGTDVYIEIDWFPDSAAMTGTDAVRWTIEYRSIAEGELINQGTSVTVDNGAGGDTSDYSQYQTKHTRFTLTFNNANQPLTAQDHMYFKISRDTAVANDFAGSVTISAYEIIYNSKGFPTSN